MVLQNYNDLFNFMEVLGKRWAMPLLIFLLLCEKTRFSQMKKQLKVTSRALSLKLKLLGDLGLIEKITINKPRKMFYSLSDKGRRISQILLKILLV